jgi:multimeric flavodoxin WrbA
MKIALMIGSPKNTDSTSGIIAKALRSRMEQEADCVICNAVKQKRSEIMEAFAGCRALVFVFPLYVDAVPSHLLRLLDDTWSEIAEAAPGAVVYAVVNNGFYEGRQNAVALEIMRNFCTRSDLKWGQGLGVGAGGMISALPVGYGPMKNLGKALDLLARNILHGRTAEDYMFEPNFPKFLYKMAAHMKWRLQAGKNGLKI